MKNKMVDLRNHLFAAIEALMDGDENMDTYKAKAIADLGKVLVDSARAETEVMQMMRKDPYALGIKGTGFLELESTVPLNPKSFITQSAPEEQKT